VAHLAKRTRYDNMLFRRCGKSGLQLPAISLGLWQNFGGFNTFENSRAMIFTAFDLGVCHFDLANNYGPPAGSAEENFGRILKKDLAGYRDELVISTKAGHYMWPGPYGDLGSRKHLLASLDQSLKRMGLEYVDIFYSHRPDPETPLDETMRALSDAIKQGKALYAGISSYSAEQSKKAIALLDQMQTKCLIHQPNYSMLNRDIENGLQDVLEQNGVGSIAFCPLAQGLLTDKYLKDIPADSRAVRNDSLHSSDITEQLKRMLMQLNDIAKQRGQSLAQMALAWVLRKGKVTSALTGASSPSQIVENVSALRNIDFSESELQRIDAILES